MRAVACNRATPAQPLQPPLQPPPACQPSPKGPGLLRLLIRHPAVPPVLQLGQGEDAAGAGVGALRSGGGARGRSWAMRRGWGEGGPGRGFGQLGAGTVQSCQAFWPQAQLAAADGICGACVPLVCADEIAHAVHIPQPTVMASLGTLLKVRPTCVAWRGGTGHSSRADGLGHWAHPASSAPSGGCRQGVRHGAPLLP